MAEGLVDATWLHAHLNDPTLKVFDGSWYLRPRYANDAAADFATAHIPRARRFDVDDVTDPDSALEHMLPPPQVFEDKVRALGVNAGDQIVVYDLGVLIAAPRVWWMFRAMGHDRVAVLDGGLPAWLAAGYPTVGVSVAPRPGNFIARYRPELFRGLADMRRNLDTRSDVVVDARSPGRFWGREPEDQAPRAGHIPGSVCLPTIGLIDPATRRFRPLDELAAVFRAAGVDPARPIATTCGSGIAACTLALALFLLGNRSVGVYDGSWTEWGASPDVPVAV
ncbi:MAG: sulfurtransferase [Alphaproteobacteria bacterium]|nr:sulfurtransferase [Alphaproteobacteria bacterium]